MARDPQAAVTALNRFGFGARGGASGDLVNAASDPRGFIKVDLQRPGGALLEVPGLQPTPALAEVAFAYQAEIRQARATAKANAASKPETPVAEAKPAEAAPPKMSPADMSEKMASMDMPEKGNANAPMQANEAAPPARPLNVIQKTFRAEALARLQRAVQADCGLGERLGAVWANH